jgi:tRNA threonylcarbamoyladenosine biosynthesis protein TsaB
MSPLVLAVDTTGEYGSLALARGLEIVEEAALHSKNGFAHVIYGELAALLGRCGVKLEDVDCFASASGPGSFTGVRVGLACVKGLAEAMRKPAVAVSNLQALAAFGSAPLRAPVLDARRGEVYGGLYDAHGCAASPETVAKLSVWLASLPETGIEFVTADLPALPAALSGTRFAEARITAAPRALAGAIARIAATRFPTGGGCDPAALDANYVRRSDAELFWKE